MEVSIIFKIAAVGILVSVLSQVLKHSGRDEQAFLVSLAGLLVVLFWIVPIYMNCLTVSGNCLNFSNCPAVCFWKNTEQLQTIKSAGGRYPWILSRFLFLEYVV